MLGEPGTEQFEVTTEVAGEIVHRQKLHDPFIRTATTVRGFVAAWKCLFGGLRVETRVNGSNGAMDAVMRLDPVAFDYVGSLNQSREQSLMQGGAVGSSSG